MKMKITLELTDEQYNALFLALLLAPSCCRRQAEAWEKLAEETDENGAPKYPVAAENADFYTEKALRSEELYNLIRGL